MRGATRFLSLIIFTVALAYALGCTWVTQEFGNESGFVDLTSSLARDPDVGEAVNHAVVVNLSEEGGLPPGWAVPIAQATSQAFDEAMSSGRFDDAWEESMRRTHRHLFTDPIPDAVRIDVAPFLNVVVDDSDLLQGLGARVPEELLVPVAEVGPEEHRLVAGIMTASSHRTAAWIVAALSAVLALVSSPARTLGRTVTALGAVSLLVTVAWGVIGRWGLNELVESAVERDRSQATLTRSVGTLMIDSLQSFLVPVAAVGLVVTVAGVLMRALARRQG